MEYFLGKEVEKITKDLVAWLNENNYYLKDNLDENNKIKSYIISQYIPNQKDLDGLKIEELKKNLNDTDYKAIKYAEGEISKEDYEPIKLKRQQWRDEINRLQI